MMRNYPNPFSSGTTIAFNFSNPVSGRFAADPIPTFEVYDIAGKKIADLSARLRQLRPTAGPVLEMTLPANLFPGAGVYMCLCGRTAFRNP